MMIRLIQTTDAENLDASSAVEPLQQLRSSNVRILLHGCILVAWSRPKQVGSVENARKLFVQPNATSAAQPGTAEMQVTFILSA
jgi:hypothetical protein